MATTFKPFTSDDITTHRTLLHEAIPITGAMISGTYGGVAVATGSEGHIKNFPKHGMFQSVYDYPHLSSSANHIFDITVGYSSGSALKSSSNKQDAKKTNIYNQMAQILMGHDLSGAIKPFQIPGQSEPMRECWFINFSRLLTKDEIKKGSFSLVLGTGSALDHGFVQRRTYTDDGAATNYYTDSPAGEYAIMSSSKTAGINNEAALGNQGLLFYQAGILVLTGTAEWTALTTGSAGDTQTDGAGNTGTLRAMFSGSSISASANAIRHRMYNVEFNNTTELNSTIYFCRFNHNDFNYSSNPTYLSESTIRVKLQTLDQSVTYGTTIGLYSADNELLAVTKFSEPLKKNPSQEFIVRVRLDY